MGGASLRLKTRRVRIAVWLGRGVGLMAMRPVGLMSSLVFAATLLAGMGTRASAQTVDPFYNLIPLVAGGLTTPRALTFTPDTRILISERTTGRIRVVKDGVLLARPFADVAVNYAGDRGALGLAAAPDFATSRKVFLLYAHSSTGLDTPLPPDFTDLRLVSFTASGDTALAGSETLLRSFALDPALTTHVGGGLRFGPEGALYLGLGDADAVPSPALQLDALPGKLLRLDASGAAWPGNIYALDGNPATLPEIFAYGFHDPAYFSVYRYDDPGPPKVVLSDAGAGADDEIDEAVAGKNYGWPNVHGKVDTPAEIAYVGTLLNYGPTTWTSGAVSARPTGVAAAFEESSSLPFPAIYWGQASPNGGSCQLRVAYDVFSLPGSPVIADFGTGFEPVTDVSFPIWHPMPVLPLFDALYVLSGSALCRVTPNQPNAAPPGPGSTTALAHAGPNPTRGDALISCTLPANTCGHVVIHDLSGRRVRVIEGLVEGPETSLVRWDGRDEEGRRTRAGLYFARLVLGDRSCKTAALRMVRLP